MYECCRRIQSLCVLQENLASMCARRIWPSGVVQENQLPCVCTVGESSLHVHSRRIQYPCVFQGNPASMCVYSRIIQSLLFCSAWEGTTDFPYSASFPLCVWGCQGTTEKTEGVFGETGSFAVSLDCDGHWAASRAWLNVSHRLRNSYLLINMIEDYREINLCFLELFSLKSDSI